MIYFIGNESGQVKIGYSVNPTARLSDLQIGTPDRLTILAVLPLVDIETEKEYHEKYDYCKIGGEWFLADTSMMSEIESLREMHGVDNIAVKSTKNYKKFLFNTDRDRELLAWLEKCENQSKAVRDALYLYIEQDSPEEVTTRDLSNKLDILSTQLKRYHDQQSA